MSVVLANADAITRAARLLRDGGIVAFPTETVYGLGADARNADAVRRMYAIKGRPEHHPVIVHVEGLDAANAWSSWPTVIGTASCSSVRPILVTSRY